MVLVGVVLKNGAKVTVEIDVVLGCHLRMSIVFGGRESSHSLL